MRHFGPEFFREYLLHLPGCCNAERRHKLLGSLAPIRVEGEQKAVLATDVTSQALQGSLSMVPGLAITCYEDQDVGHEQYDAVRIKVESVVRFAAEVYG